MDFVSHGLWGSIAFGRNNKRSFWTAFCFGIGPDILSFGIFILATAVGFQAAPNWTSSPELRVIPEYVHSLYNVTHSLIIFLAAFGIVWVIRKKPFWEMSAWALHILFDIPLHSTRFFPTPFLWPFFDYRYDGISWSRPIIFIPNIIALILLYVWYFFVCPRREQARKSRKIE